MKKFVISMVVIILIGAVLTGIGCAVFFTRDFTTEKLEYVEKLFESEEAVCSISMKLENAHKVTFERGEKCSVKYFDSNVSEFSISVQNGKLIISESGSNWKNWLKMLFYRFETTNVIITVPEGAVFDINGTFNGAVEAVFPSWQYGDINLDVNGASSIAVNGINANEVSINASGATACNLSGNINSLKTDVSGSAIMRCDGLVCNLINIRSAGSCDITLTGSGKDIFFDASGSGKLWAKNFAIEKAEIEASGSVDAELTVSTLLKVSASGSAQISYWGEPQVDKHVSGSANIVKKG